MQNGRIRSSQLSTSSSWDRNHGPSNGRLHLRRAGARVGAWVARHNTRLQWYQANFGRPTRVVKIATQGRQDSRQWVTQYYLTFSQDGVHFAEYEQNSNRKVCNLSNTRKNVSSDFQSSRSGLKNKTQWSLLFNQLRGVWTSNEACQAISNFWRNSKQKVHQIL